MAAQDQRGLPAATGPGVIGSGTVTGVTIAGTVAQVNATLATLTDTSGRRWTSLSSVTGSEWGPDSS